MQHHYKVNRCRYILFQITYIRFAIYLIELFLYLGLFIIYVYERFLNKNEMLCTIDLQEVEKKNKQTKVKSQIAAQTKVLGDHERKQVESYRCGDESRAAPHAVPVQQPAMHARKQNKHCVGTYKYKVRAGTQWEGGLTGPRSSNCAPNDMLFD